ncbi:hypothetical protein CKM354_001019900 [Cercospora kikuchii]|uniref:Uncharacterized protein n=1 Tax=Cercospora kikuchii TaxID=84275 RepID=A0A9P3CYQ3_9PEZI|nr:uncharacterized protein CKM354_001019900 [Cercospora kikuchii]GIZ47098.1 hypothetical protein CKM354_001019900 [Cercospora kikuchii]
MENTASRLSGQLWELPHKYPHPNEREDIMNEKFEDMWYQFLAPLRPAVDPKLVMHWAYGMNVAYRTWIARNTDYKEIPIHIANGYLQGLVE